MKKRTKQDRAKDEKKRDISSPITQSPNIRIQRHPAQRAGLAPRKPASKTALMERMLAPRRQRRHIPILELKKTDPALIHSDVQQRQLQLDDALVCRAPAHHLNTPDERDVVVEVGTGTGFRGG